MSVALTFSARSEFRPLFLAVIAGLAAVIALRLRQKQRNRQVRADAQAREAVAAHGIVDMDAEMMAVRRGIAVEQRPKDMARNGRRKETRIRRQRRNDAVAKLTRDLAVRRQLLIAFDHRRLRASSHRRAC